MDRINRLYLIRHGQIIGFDKFPICGHTDVGLTEVGFSQLEHLAERLRYADIRALYSSDLARSVNGARTIARRHVAPLHALHELREIYFGDWEGKTLSELHEHYPTELEKRQKDPLHFRPPGNGESVAQLSKRILNCVEGFLKEQKGHDIALVGHGVVNRVILSDALGLELDNIFNIQQDFGCLNIIDYFNDRRVVKLLNG